MNRKMVIVFSLILYAMFFVASSHADTIDQYASSLLGFSSQFTTPGHNNYAAINALGSSYTSTWGNDANTWSPGNHSASEYITLGFATAVHATGVTIRENFYDGGITKIELIDKDGNLHLAWAGSVTPTTQTLVDFTKTWASTSYLVTGVKITLDNRDLAYAEIDSVKLTGSASSVPIPPSALLLLPGLAGMMFVRSRKQK